MPEKSLVRNHILTVALEDYFHVAPLTSVVDRRRWYRFEMRLEQATDRTLDLLDRFGACATFFVLGWVAEAAPELVRKVATRGHAIASKGFLHRPLKEMDRAAFLEDAIRSREALLKAGAGPVSGFRMPQGWFGREDLWALDVLAEAGYRYDSSVRLVGRSFAGEPWRQHPHWTQAGERPFLEVPLPSVSVAGVQVPIAGGNYFRQLPAPLMRAAVARWIDQHDAPFVMYFHTWELDPDQPRLNGVPFSQRVRQYRNLDRMPELLSHYLSRYRFTSVETAFAAELGTAAESARAVPEPIPTPVSASIADPAPSSNGAHRGQPRESITIVIPCFNEAQSLPYLANTLRSVTRELSSAYDVRLVLVDDRSTDATWSVMGGTFESWPACRLVRHDRNRGVAAAIHTGIQAAETEIVCSIDCDCTYDPHELVRMIPLLTDDVDLVTASPYHPDGAVRNVPPSRLLLSKSLSWMYRIVLRGPLYTYTSCFRIYRRSAAVGLGPRHGDFLGIAEILGRMEMAGSRIVEYPATLEARVLGRSKMKVARTIVRHLGLLASFAGQRARTSFKGRIAASVVPE